MEEYITNTGQRLIGVHSVERCQGRSCVVHSPTDHHMREWPQHWREDRTIFERVCEHGTGHPDPDQLEYWEETEQEYQATHGCDFCCTNKEEEI